MGVHMLTICLAAFQAPKQEVFKAIQNKDPAAVADKLNKATKSECSKAHAGGAQHLALLMVACRMALCSKPDCKWQSAHTWQ